MNLDEFNEALSNFRSYLGLSSVIIPKLLPLEPFINVPLLKNLQLNLDTHPALLAQRDGVNAAQSEIKLVRSGKFSDPKLNLYRERGFLDGRRQDITGVGITFSVPLWDRKRGRIIEARERVNEREYRLQALERNLRSQLQQSHYIWVT